MCINKTDYPIPGNVLIWLQNLDPIPHAPAKENKQPLPAEYFRAIIKACDDYTNRPKQRQYNDPVQMKAVFYLTVNAALGNVNVCTLQRRHLRLDADIPHMDFARTKVNWKIGRDVERLTPLAPETVAALKEWLAQDRSSQWLFVSATGAAWKNESINDAFVRMKELAGYNSDYTFKHLRNVAATVCRNAKLPREMAQTILGHTIDGTDQFYTGDADVEYLVPLVGAIRQDYFGGE